MQTIDIYAYTNPVFLSANIYEFLKGYQEKKKSCFYPVVYLATPIILSKKINKYFDHTNKKTEFLNWLYKHPEIQLEISQMINKTKKYTNKAIVFGIQTQIFSITEKGYVSVNKSISKKGIVGNDLVYMKYSNRLGYWLGSLNENDIFYSLGVLL